MAMPVGSLLSLLDDITVVLDDVWVMSKLSAQKTAGVLGDDLALNAQQALGLKPERELPVIAAVARGSARNKGMLVPLALVLRGLAAWAIQPLLMLGGTFLCYEGAEKVLHKLRPSSGPAPQEQLPSEEERIGGAIRTDLVLSAEILAITLGQVADQPFLKVLLVLLVISVIMTLGVYGAVALIIKLDDIGLALQSFSARWKRALGSFLLALAPRLLALLSSVGTLAIFCVGGGILVHGLPPLHHLVEGMSTLPALAFEGLVGLISGSLVVAVTLIGRRLKA